MSVTSPSRTTTPGRLNELAALIVGVWSQASSICRVGGIGLAGELLRPTASPKGSSVRCRPDKMHKRVSGSVDFPTVYQ